MEKGDLETPISYIDLLRQLVFNAQAGLVLRADKPSNAGRADTCGSVQSLKKHAKNCFEISKQLQRC